MNPLMVFARSSRTVGLALTFGILTFGCGRHKEPAQTNKPELPTVQVRVQKVETQKLPSHAEVMGTIRARLRATLEANVSGRIEEMPVRLGDAVKAGQLVARLNAPEINARLQQAEASVQQAERDWSRAKALFEQQATTRSEFESAESRFSVAKATLEEAKAMLAYVEVKAPFDGVITRKHADVGDLAAPGKALVQLEDSTALQLEADIPEAIAGTIQPQSQLTVKLDGVPQEFSAQVSEIAPIIDPLSRTLQVKLDLPQQPGVRSGQFARLIVPVAESETLRVPASAVVRRGQLEIAFVVADNTAHLNLVKTGRRTGSDVEILSGLEPGQAVVVAGAQQLVDNQPVSIQ
jgi:RND family efflux transporter MFP subunit